MTSETVSLLQTLIRNQCVNDGTPGSGHEHRSVETLLEFFGVDGEVFEPMPGRQSLVYRVAGQDSSAPALALVPHLDVVPADPDGWSVDPFSAEVNDGFVYGRGAIDMLNVTAAMAVAVRPYLRGEIRPGGDLVFAAVADEEAGGVYGAKALVEERWDLAQAPYLLTEVAYPPPENARGAVVPVAVGEKGVFWSTVRSTGVPGHGSTPFGADNALEKLAEALHGLFKTPSPVMIGDEWVSFVQSLDLDPELPEQLVDPDRVDAAIGVLAVSDPRFASYAHALTHLTVSPNRAVAGTKANIIADKAKAEVDIRALPGMDRHFIDSHLLKAMGSARDDVEIEPHQDLEATVSGTNNPLWTAIADSVEEIEGHRNLLPMMMTVGTDGRFWRTRGSVAYGVGLYDERMTFSEMLGLFHGHDEKVSIGSVNRTTQLYELVLQKFLGD